MSVVSGHRAAGETLRDAVAITVTPLFEATWSYEEFVSLKPFGEKFEGQAYAYANAGKVVGERLSGEYTLVQYPRRGSDDVLIPDAHGMVRVSTDQVLMTRAGGFAIPIAGGRRAITHWMRFVAGSEFAWLNTVVAAGIGEFVDEVAKVRYAQVRPAAPGEAADDRAHAVGMKFSMLGTATFEYQLHETTRPIGDRDGQSFGRSIGRVENGELAGSWRGWHYSSYGRDEVHRLDAHAEIATTGGRVLIRYGGVASSAETGSARERLYDEVQYATFTTEVPALKHLNRTLAIGVGRATDPGAVTVSYYGLAALSS